MQPSLHDINGLHHFGQIQIQQVVCSTHLKRRRVIKKPQCLMAKGL